jgi:hypothetical protein
VRRVVVVLTEFVEPLVYACEDLVGLIDHTKVKWFCGEQRVPPVLTSGGFATDKEHALTVEAPDSCVPFARRYIEKLEELLPPLAE